MSVSILSRTIEPFVVVVIGWFIEWLASYVGGMDWTRMRSCGELCNGTRVKTGRRLVSVFISGLI